MDKVESFPGKVGGKVLRFPVPAGTPAGDRSVKEAVADGLAALVAEHRAAVTAFGSDVLTRAAERIRQARFKLEAYAAYLADRGTAGGRPGGGGRRAEGQGGSGGRGGDVMPRPPTADVSRGLPFLSNPALWPAWPFLPVVRRTRGRGGVGGWCSIPSERPA